MMDLLQACVIGLLLVLGTPSSTATVNLTSTPSGTVFCNGSEVIFTCETRGSVTLTWRGDNFYVGAQILFLADTHPINFTTTSLSNDNTRATVTQNFTDPIASGVLVFVSTLRIKPLLEAPTGNVICVHANGTEQRINFQVLARPAVPQVVVTVPLEPVQNVCPIATVLGGPTNPSEANNTVSVDRASVLYRNAELISRDGTRHSALLYDTSCGAHNITISANNICGESPSTNIALLDTQLLSMLNVTLPMVDRASNAEGSVIMVIVGVVLAAFKYLLDFP